MNVDALIAQLNPVPEPASEVDDDRRVTLLREILTTPAPRERHRPTVRRLAVAAATLALATVGASAALLAGGERTGEFAVLTALADELSEPGRILHTLERTTVVGSGGDVHEEETWTLLDDMRYQRFRIGTGRAYEESARAPGSSIDYQRRTNTVYVARYPEQGSPLPVDDLPVQRLARAAAEGEVAVEARVEVRGRRALKIREGGSAWYIAEDAPVLLRYELKRADKRIQRTEFVAFEILPATPDNRRLLEVDPPAGAEREVVQVPAPPTGGD